MTAPNHRRNIAYIVKAWPRLSETFVLNEIISLEQRGLPIRIFAVREPDPGPSHSKVSQVRAKVTCLALRPHWKQAAAANLRLLRRQPGRYLRVFFHVVTSKVARRRFGVPRHFFQAGYLADILSREPADHLHAHFASTPARVAMLVHRLTGIPFTFTAHAKDIYLSDSGVFRGKLEEARTVVTCTEYNRSFLLKQHGQLAAEKVRCIYHGLDTSQFKFHTRQAVENGETVILSVARLIEKKGLEDLLAAADILRRRGRVCRVEIIGGGPLREALKAQAKLLGLADRVRLLGAQTHDAVCLAYRRASVFVLPCVVASNGDRDGIPNVLLEAMASGLPVVSTPVSGIPELIESGKNGLLVPPHDPRNLADAIDSLLGSRELSEHLARAAKARLEASFSLEASAERLLAIFDETTKAESPCIDVNAAVAAQRAAPFAEGS